MALTLGGSAEHPCEVEIHLDRISSLPEHLADTILSNLSIMDVVRTSVLSKRWRYKWRTVPSLVFDDQFFPVASHGPLFKKKLVSAIEDVFLHHNGPIRKFKLSHNAFKFACYDGLFYDIDRWIGYISTSCVREIILEVSLGIREIILEISLGKQRYKIPSCLFSCQSLTDLKLENCLLDSPPTFKGFKNLKRLDLRLITIIKNVLENLICSCPLLESLIIVDCDGFTDLNIDAPNLEFLELRGVLHDVSFENTFSLTSICIGCYLSIKHIHSKPKAGESSGKLIKFFANLPHIQKLECRIYFWEYLACGNIPSNLPNKCLDLKHLDINVDFKDRDETEAALCLLRSSPNLIELEIWAHPTGNQLDEGTYTNLWENDLWSSLFAHLRVAKICSFSGFRSELDFVNFILTNAPVLESMTIKPEFKDGNCELLKKLLRFRRASMHLEIIYADADEDP